MKVAVSLIVIFLIFGIIVFFAIPFLLQNVTFPGFSAGGKGVAGIFKTVDGGDFWFSKNNIESSKSTISTANILDIVFDPFDNNIMYVGTDGVGIFKSMNNGESWKRIIDENNMLGTSSVINQISVNPKNASHIFVAAFQNNNGGVYKTEDAGHSWKQMYVVPLSNQDIKSVAIDHSNPNILYTGTTAGGFLASSDGGESWRVLKWFFDPIKKIYINPYNSSELFVLIEDKALYRSSDKGNNWIDLTSTFSGYPSATKIENLIFDQQRPGVIYAPSAYGLLRSDNNGSSWRALKILVSPEALPVRDVAIDKNDFKKIYMSAGSKIYISDDEGENWVVKSLDTGKNAKIIKIDPKNSKIIFIGIHK